MITLSEAIKEFAKQTYDTVKVKGGKNYIQVKDRLNFVRETFGERVSIRINLNPLPNLIQMPKLWRMNF